MRIQRQGLVAHGRPARAGADHQRLAARLEHGGDGLAEIAGLGIDEHQQGPGPQRLAAGDEELRLLTSHLLELEQQFPARHKPLQQGGGRLRLARGRRAAQVEDQVRHLRLPPVAQMPVDKLQLGRRPVPGAQAGDGGRQPFGDQPAGCGRRSSGDRHQLRAQIQTRQQPLQGGAVEFVQRQIRATDVLALQDLERRLQRRLRQLIHGRRLRPRLAGQRQQQHAGADSTVHESLW